MCYPGHNNLDDLWLAQANDLSRINTHGLQHKENCIQRNVLLDAICTKQSYEIKSPPWTILGFRILGIFSVKKYKEVVCFYVSNLRQ